MGDIILSKKQQKKALRTKKSNKQTVKNVLAAPEQSFWPLLKNDDVSTIHKALEINLPRVRQEKVPVKYKDIANLSKADRKVYRANLMKNEDQEDTEKKNVIFGVNYIDKLVCANEVCLVLISADASPRSIVEGLLEDCLAKEVTVLVVPELRRILKQFCGVSSVVFGIKKNNDEVSKICELEKVVKDLSKVYCQEKPNGAVEVLSIMQTSVLEDRESIEEVRDVSEIYLYRKLKTRRVFPEKVEVIAEQKPKLKRSLGKECDSKDLNIGDDLLAMYRSLSVKRFRNDPSRQKKKNN